MSSGERKATGKRVRFSLTPPAVHEFQADEDDAPKHKRQAVDPMEALEGEIMGVCLAESGASTGMDAAACAARRRAARRQELLSTFEEGAGAASLGEIEGAEAGYEDPEEMFNDAGIPFEPFHLKREREEGYFDEDGNYVELKMGDVEDAWADELATVEVDEAWLTRVMSGPARQAAEVLAAGEEPDLGPEQIDGYKRKLVDLLLPGENVLQALRRLAAVRPHRAAAAGVTGGSQASPAAGDTRMLSNGQPMPPGVREKFESLTGLSSVLMDQGVYGVHSMSREQLERSMLREEELAQKAQQAVPAATPGHSGSPHGGSPAAYPMGSTAANAAADAGLQLAERLLAAAAPAAGGGRQTNGHSKNGGGGGVGSEEAVVAPVTPAVDADQDIFGAAEEDEEQAGAGSASAAGARQQQEQQQPQAGRRAEAEAGGTPVGERDSGGDVAMQEPQQPAAAAAAAQEQQQKQQEQQAAAAGTSGIGTSAAAAAAAVGAAAAAVASGGAGGASSGGQPQELDGFTRDAASGYWFNSGMGCYYDSERQLFGDASSGLWFSYDAATGQYQVAAS